MPLHQRMVQNVRQTLLVLLGAVGLVLLIACVNVANLLLARAQSRTREVAVRAALGAGRGRLVAQFLSEAILLGLLGGAAGLAAAYWCTRALVALAPASIPRLGEVAIDLRVLAFTFAVACGTSVLFGLMPALSASGGALARVIGAAGRGAVGAGASRPRRALVVCEMALAVMLLVGAGLLIRSYSRITNANPGFDARNVLSFRVSVPGFRYKTPQMVSQFYDQLYRRIKVLPGVEYVGANYQLPLSSVALAWEPIGIEGYVPKAAGNDLIISSSAYISPDYFRAMKIPLLSGRFFTEQDNKQSPEVVIVDDKLAARFWPNESAIGKRLRQGADGPWRAVVGVVADAREYEVDAEPPITAFFPVEQYNIASRFIVVRTSSRVEAASLANAVNREIQSLDDEFQEIMDERKGDEQ